MRLKKKLATVHVNLGAMTTTCASVVRPTSPPGLDYLLWDVLYRQSTHTKYLAWGLGIASGLVLPFQFQYCKGVRPPSLMNIRKDFPPSLTYHKGFRPPSLLNITDGFTPSPGSKT